MRFSRIAVLMGLACFLMGCGANAQQQAADPIGTPGPANQVAKISTDGTFVGSPWLHIDDNGSATFSNNLMGADFGELVMAPDSADIVSSENAAAGPQMHFRLTRAYCDKRSSTLQSSSDQTNFFCVPDSVIIDDAHPPSSTPNKDFLIAPYSDGMGVEYPGVIEFSSLEIGVHFNRRPCSTNETNWISGFSCHAGGHLWAEDNTDSGGVFSTAHATLVNNQVDRSQSFVLIASDLFDHTSHGDMLLAVRDPADNFRFQSGPSGVNGADDPNNYKNFTRARIDSTGKGFFDGGTQTAGADFAESIRMSGPKSDFEPGDVLVIDTSADRRVSLSQRPYSELVAGIYSTKPGVTATSHGSEDPALADEIPMAIVGIVPCNATTENGPIARGDLLVTSSTPGFAMRGTDSSKLPGAILGKALQPLPTGSGQIEVLIVLR